MGIRAGIKTVLDDFRGNLRQAVVQRLSSSTWFIQRTRPSICTVVIGISASASTILFHNAGRASCLGAAGVGAACTVGKEAAIAAAIVAMVWTG